MFFTLNKISLTRVEITSFFSILFFAPKQLCFFLQKKKSSTSERVKVRERKTGNCSNLWDHEEVEIEASNVYSILLSKVRKRLREGEGKSFHVDEEIFKAGEGGGRNLSRGGMCVCARRYERIRLPDSKI